MVLTFFFISILRHMTPALSFAVEDAQWFRALLCDSESLDHGRGVVRPSWWSEWERHIGSTCVILNCCTKYQTIPTNECDMFYILSDESSPWLTNRAYNNKIWLKITCLFLSWLIVNSKTCTGLVFKISLSVA